MGHCLIFAAIRAAIEDELVIPAPIRLNAIRLARSIYFQHGHSPCITVYMNTHQTIDIINHLIDDHQYEFNLNDPDLIHKILACLADEFEACLNLH